ncbi:VP2 [Kummerowia striata gokushovirus]|nr:VP2 [Kummerowia striata gokushovirus]
MGLLDFFEDIPIVGDVIDVVGDVFDAGSQFLGSGAGQTLVNAGSTAVSAYAADKAYESQQATNQFNAQLMRENNAFNAEQAELARQFNAGQGNLQYWRNADEARIQRDWTERMSDTQWQRAVGDMQKAGLNPMLAYSKGGNAFGGGATASSGAVSGSAASASGLARAESPANAAIHAFSSATAARKMIGELDNIKATNELIRAQADATRAQAGLSRAGVHKIFEGDIPLATSGATLHSAQTTESRTRTMHLVEDTVRVMAEANRISVQNDLTRAETRKVLEEVINAVLTGERIKAETANVKVNTALHNLAIPHAKNMSEAEKTWWMQNVAPFLRSLGLGTGISVPIRPFR